MAAVRLELTGRKLAAMALAAKPFTNWGIRLMDLLDLLDETYPTNAFSGLTGWTLDHD